LTDEVFEDNAAGRLAQAEQTLRFAKGETFAVCFPESAQDQRNQLRPFGLTRRTTHDAPTFAPRELRHRCTGPIARTHKRTMPRDVNPGYWN
jgi:hypothetical protein